MRKRDLAEALRRRQIEQGHHPAHLVNSLSDSHIIDCYIRCTRCFRVIVDGDARQYATIEDFIAEVNKELKEHKCVNLH